MKIIQSRPKTMKYPLLKGLSDVDSIVSDYGFRPLDPHRIENAPADSGGRPLSIYQKNSIVYVYNGYNGPSNAFIMVQIGTLSNEEGIA